MSSEEQSFGLGLLLGTQTAILGKNTKMVKSKGSFARALGKRSLILNCICWKNKLLGKPKKVLPLIIHPLQSIRLQNKGRSAKKKALWLTAI